MNTFHILQQFLIQCLNMLVVGNMRICNSHLPTTNTGTNVAHTIIITDSRMLIVRISITSLGSIPHNSIFVLCIPANQSTTTRCGYHLITVKWQHTKPSKGTQHLTIIFATKSLCGIFNNWNLIFVCNLHDFLAIVRHTIKCHRNNSLRFLTGFGDTIFYSLL